MNMAALPLVGLFAVVITTARLARQSRRSRMHARPRSRRLRQRSRARRLRSREGMNRPGFPGGSIP